MMFQRRTSSNYTIAFAYALHQESIAEEEMATTSVLL